MMMMIMMMMTLPLESTHVNLSSPPLPPIDNNNNNNSNDDLNNNNDVSYIYVNSEDIPVLSFCESLVAQFTLDYQIASFNECIQTIIELPSKMNNIFSFW